MIDRDRALRPLRDAAPSIERLETYESPAELVEALRATWHAIDTTLRTLLRSAPTVSDELRMAALSRTETHHDTVITELRRRDVISLRLAGRVHELMHVVESLDAATVRPGHADIAADVVAQLRAEVEGAAASHGHAAPASAARAQPARVEGMPGWAGTVQPTDAEGDADADADAAAGAGIADAARPRRRLLPPLRGPIVLVAAAAVILILAVALVFLFGRGSEMADGIDAFRAGRAGVAEQHFRAVLERDAGNVTARLYLGRILRTQGRLQEATEILSTAARLAPEDAAVRRELGYLFIGLDRAPQAAQQFRTAVELEPGEPLGWVGLYEALHRAGDPAAAEVLRRAPAEAQAMIQTGRR
jgi:tetratricopeptide (TPR) repeat protein